MPRSRKRITKKRNKSMSSTKYRKIRTRSKRGGILFQPGLNSNEAMHMFLTECTEVRFLSSGGYGILFTCTRPSTPTPIYTSMRIESLNGEINSIIIKFGALIDDDDESDTWYCDALQQDKCIQPIKSFISEINTQQEIFEETLSYLDPICPSPIYASTSTSDSMQMLALLFGKKSDNFTKRCLQSILDATNNKTIPILGILGMELADGYFPLYTYYRPPVDMNRVKLYECMARNEIINLALKTGYSNNDWNKANILINPNISGVYSGIKGKAMLIDFGVASKIEPSMLDLIKTKAVEGKYSNILDLFYTFSIPNGKMLADKPSMYGWLSNKWSNVHKDARQLMTPREMDKMLLKLARARFSAIIERRRARRDEYIEADPSERATLSLLPVDSADTASRRFQRIGGQPPPDTSDGYINLN